MAYETVLYEQKGSIGMIRLNRPERMNAVIEQMYLDIRSVLKEVREDPHIRALVLTGSVRTSPKGVGSMRARELIFTGRVIAGPEAVAMGLALKSVPVEQLMPEVLSFASALAEKAPISLSLTKALIRQGPHRDMETVLLTESEAILACMKTEDWREGVRSFAEKRKPVFKGR
ncbi:MAG: hypothetical protein B6240_14435 [Desulfobacteraceae bacterium 4572_87]|nr:MAG: hypothetical protein B6240_14435 [Desulfobacteraceae bacterium 4572_87]